MPVQRYGLAPAALAALIGLAGCAGTPSLNQQDPGNGASPRPGEWDLEAALAHDSAIPRDFWILWDSHNGYRPARTLFTIDAVGNARLDHWRETGAADPPRTWTIGGEDLDALRRLFDPGRFDQLPRSNLNPQGGCIDGGPRKTDLGNSIIVCRNGRKSRAVQLDDGCRLPDPLLPYFNILVRLMDATP